MYVYLLRTETLLSRKLRNDNFVLIFLELSKVSQDER